ncbi:MAG: hypothetical protein ACRETT_01175, partial [Steroidobacteraceae bacterium]
QAIVRSAWALAASLIVGASAIAAEEVEELDPEVLVLTFHKITGKPFDFDRAELQIDGGMALGWGPTVDPALLSYRVRDGHALTMNVNSPADFMDQALNSRPKVNVALQLIDPEWAAKAR